MREVGEIYGYKTKKIDGEELLVNEKGNPRYLVISNSSHSGDVFKGFNDKGKAVSSAKRGSSRKEDRVGSYNIRLERVGD